jgi:Tol biopolymer transport system component
MRKNTLNLFVGWQAKEYPIAKIPKQRKNTCMFSLAGRFLPRLGLNGLGLIVLVECSIPMCCGAGEQHNDNSAGRIFAIWKLDKDTPWQLVAVDPESGVHEKLLNDVSSVRVSPNGKALLSVKTGSDKARKLFISDLKGTNSKQIAQDIAGPTVWSSDSKYVVWSSSVASNGITNRITYRFNVESDDTKPLPVADTDTVQDWSSDGKWLLTLSQRDGPPAQLYITHLDGTGQRRVTQDGFNIFVRFSPDSRKIVFTSYAPSPRGLESRLVSMDLEGGNQQEIINEPNIVVGAACWSPDGTRIAVMLNDKPRPGSTPVGPALNYRIEIVNGKNRRPLDLPKVSLMVNGDIDWR